MELDEKIFEENLEPLWLKTLITILEKESLDELVKIGDRTLIGTKAQENISLNILVEEKNFTRSLQDFAHRKLLRLDPFSPFTGGSLYKGMYRWQTVIPPLVQEPSFFLRRHRFESLHLDSFDISTNNLETLEKIHTLGDSFLVAGPCGVGKTSFLHAYLKKYSLKKRLIFLEDYEEIPLSSPFWLRLLSKKEDIEFKKQFSLSFLFKESLRLRPDGLVLGELRQEEIKTFLEAKHSGHQGTCGTIHVASQEDFHYRILLSQNESMILKETKFWLIFLETKKENYRVKEICQL